MTGANPTTQHLRALRADVMAEFRRRLKTAMRCLAIGGGLVAGGRMVTSGPDRPYVDLVVMGVGAVFVVGGLVAMRDVLKCWAETRRLGSLLKARGRES